MLKKIIYEYKKLSLPIKASFWFMICSFAQKAVTMITTPIFTRIMSMEEYGKVNTFLSWQVLFECVLTLCLTSCAMQLYVRRQDKEYVLSVLCSLEFLVMGIWNVLILIFVNPISSLLGMSGALCVCMGVIIWFNQSIQLWMEYKRYKYEYKALVIVTFLSAALPSFLGAFAVIFISPSAELRIIPTAIISLVIGGYIYIRIIFRYRVIFDKVIWITAFNFGIPFIFTNLSHFILASSDRLMINYMCGSKDVALYGISYSIGSIITILMTAINASFAPYTYQKIQKKDFKSLSKRTVEILILVGTTLSFIMLFSKEIVLIFGGEHYLEASTIIIPICFGVYFNYIVQLFTRIQEYLLRKTSLLLPALFCAVLNIILNIIFIKLYGYKAAAYTTFISYFLFCFVHYLIYKKIIKNEFKVKRIYDMKYIVLISVLLIFIGVMIDVISQWLIVKYAILCIFSLLAVIRRKSIIKYIKNILEKV